eukprot:8501831-Alexandrium_andersonii.AAC.1
MAAGGRPGTADHSGRMGALPGGLADVAAPTAAHSAPAAGQGAGRGPRAIGTALGAGQAPLRVRLVGDWRPRAWPPPRHQGELQSGHVGKPQ